DGVVGVRGSPPTRWKTISKMPYREVDQQVSSNRKTWHQHPMVDGGFHKGDPVRILGVGGCPFVLGHELIDRCERLGKTAQCFWCDPILLNRFGEDFDRTRTFLSIKLGFEPNRALFGPAHHFRIWLRHASIPISRIKSQERRLASPHDDNIRMLRQRRQRGVRDRIGTYRYV